MKSDLNSRSKYLSYLLRHCPEQANLTVLDDGWVDVKQLLKNTDFTLTELKTIVDNDSKKRYSFDQYYTKIRANQGHSIDVKMSFKPFTPTTFLYHGTSDKYRDSILKNGIMKMSRQYVHLSQDITTARKVGVRHGGKLVIFKVDAVRMYNDGIKLFISENGVVLTDFVDGKYISIVEEV